MLPATPPISARRDAAGQRRWPYVMASPKARSRARRARRVYFAASAPPRFTTDNHRTVLVFQRTAVLPELADG